MTPRTSRHSLGTRSAIPALGIRRSWGTTSAVYSSPRSAFSHFVASLYERSGGGPACGGGRIESEGQAGRLFPGDTHRPCCQGDLRVERLQVGRGPESHSYRCMYAIYTFSRKPTLLSGTFGHSSVAYGVLRRRRGCPRPGPGHREALSNGWEELGGVYHAKAEPSPTNHVMAPWPRP